VKIAKKRKKKKLNQEVLDKKAIKKNHESEIINLETQTNIRVDYSIDNSGLTAVLSPRLILKPEFLPEPVCYSGQFPLTSRRNPELEKEIKLYGAVHLEW